MTRDSIEIGRLRIARRRRMRRFTRAKQRERVRTPRHAVASREGGFTLLELLIVVGIIGLLLVLNLSTMNCFIRPEPAVFSLVEVTLALGVAAICLIASVFSWSGGRLPRRSDPKAGVGCGCRSRLNSQRSTKNPQRCSAVFTFETQRERASAFTLL